MTPEFKAKLLAATEKRVQLLNTMGSLALSATSLTRLLHPGAAVPGPEYNNIRRHLVKLTHRGVLTTAKAIKGREVLYWKR